MLLKKYQNQEKNSISEILLQCFNIKKRSSKMKYANFNVIIKKAKVNLKIYDNKLYVYTINTNKIRKVLAQLRLI